MKYQKELDIIVKEMQNAYHSLYALGFSVSQKTKHDLVTSLDKGIEEHLSNVIHSNFEGDKILGEELSNNTSIEGRTWTIDPIDGTCNMASGIDLYGVQCSLFEDKQIVLSAIYIPTFNYLITAVKGEGCFFNGKRVFISPDVNINNAIISFGDYPHDSSSKLALWQHNAIKNIFNTVAKIRMFGSACIDLSFVATSKIHGTVIVNGNLWDIAPGILLCQEAGAYVVDLDGNGYSTNAEGIIVGANKEITDLLVNAFAHNKYIK